MGFFSSFFPEQYAASGVSALPPAPSPSFQKSPHPLSRHSTTRVLFNPLPLNAKYDLARAVETTASHKVTLRLERVSKWVARVSLVYTRTGTKCPGEWLSHTLAPGDQVAESWLFPGRVNSPPARKS